MKKSILALLLLFSAATVVAQSEAQIKFVNSFMDNVMQHNDKGVLKHMDKAYRKEQIKFLNGNTTQFLNELLSGTSVLTGEWTNISFENILKIEVAEVIALEDGNFEYIFRIRTESVDLMQGLLLHTGKKFGFEGARG